MAPSGESAVCPVRRVATGWLAIVSLVASMSGGKGNGVA